MQSNQTNQQGKVEFKVGDKFIVTKQSFRDQGYTEVYTVSKTDSFNMIHFLSHNNEEALAYPNEIEHYTPEPEKHIHHDLIVAWAKDPKGCVIQWRNPAFLGDPWRDSTANKPGWADKLEYRIKPKTEQVTRWKWAFLAGGDQIMESTAYYTVEEANKQFKNAIPYKLEHTAITATEEV